MLGSYATGETEQQAGVCLGEMTWAVPGEYAPQQQRVVGLITLKVGQIALIDQAVLRPSCAAAPASVIGLQPPVSQLRPRRRWRATQTVLFAAGTLAGVVAITSALGAWPLLSATRLGLDPRGAFCLLAGGTYLLAAALYSAVRTRLLLDLRRAPGDAKGMAYAVLIAGGVLTASVVVVLFAVAGAIRLLATLAALCKGHPS